MKIEQQYLQLFEHLELSARQMVEGFITGLHRSPYHGFSVEFAEHKIYNPGQSTRHIDWKVYAKTDRLYTKRYQEETNLRALLLIDTSASMYYPQPGNAKIKFAVLAAACIACLLQRQRDAVGLSTFADRIILKTETKTTKTHLHKLYASLEQIANYSGAPNNTTAAADILHQIAESTHARSLVIIFSDMFEHQNHEELFGALGHLRHKGHETLLFHVTDKKTEQNFEFSNRVHEFIDLENQTKIKIRPEQVRQAYKNQMHKFVHELKLRCGQNKIDFIEADVALPASQVLMPFLIRRQKMV